MNRRNFTVSLLTAVLTGTGFVSVQAQQQSEYLNSTVYKFELYALTDEQKLFIDDIIHLAENNIIPPATVEKCFLYARKKEKRHRRYYYFREALKEVLTKQGYDITSLLEKAEKYRD